MAALNTASHPEPTRVPSAEALTESLTDALRRILGRDLSGVYLHGSLALGCFHPEHSDIDLLLVVRQGLAPEQQRDVVRALLDHSANPYPLDVSIIHEAALFPWRYPTPVLLRYNEDQRAGLELALADGSWASWGQDGGLAWELALHIRLLNERGQTRYGQPIADTFPSVPMQHFVDAMLRDLRAARQDMMVDPVYAVLNQCRAYYFLQDDVLASKEEAGQWTMGMLHPRYLPVLKHCLNYYRGVTNQLPFDPIDLGQLVGYLEARIAQLLIERGLR